MSKSTDDHYDVSGLSISSTLVQDGETTKKLIRMAKRRRSSAASRRPSDTVMVREQVSPVTKEKKRKSQPIPSVELLDAKKVKFSSLRDVILFALQAQDTRPNYIKIENRQGIEKCVLLMIPGIDASQFGIIEHNDIQSPRPLTISPLSFLSDEFEQFIPTIAPGNKDSIYPLMKALSMRPYTKNEKLAITSKLSEQKLVLPDLAMSLEDFSQHDYPIHGSAQKPDDDWVDTVNFDHEGSHTFGLDCEMCDTASGKVLTRVSLIDFDENVILDEYVKPKEGIIDYLTKYSGITEDLLKDVKTTLKDIQEKFLKIVSSSDYLIGHSLENDLNVLKIRHPKVIDTALVFEHPRGPPFKSSLKYLTRQYLQREIQTGEHDSVEDSKACLDLVKLKLVEGALLGKVIDGQSMLIDLEKSEKTSCIIDYNRVQPNQSKYFQCQDDSQIKDLVLQNLKAYDLIIANLKGYEFEKTSLKELNEILRTIYSSLPLNSLVMVATGTGNQNEMKQLVYQKRQFNNEYNSKKAYEDIETSWSSHDEDKLKEITNIVRRGACFIKVKDEIVVGND